MSDLEQTRIRDEHRAATHELDGDERPLPTRFGRGKSRRVSRPWERADADRGATAARDAARDELVFEDHGGL